MLLAAGRGERLRPLTESLPKALVDVGGRSLIERHLDALSAAGVENVVINLGWLGKQIVRQLGSGERYGVRIIYSDEGDNILETGGGIQRALPFLGDRPFLVVNADILCDLDFASLEQEIESDAHLILVPRPEDRDGGDFGLGAGRVVNEPADYVFAGIAIYRPEFFAGVEPGRFSVAPMLRDGADAGRVSGELYEGYWSDVGTPARLEAARQVKSTGP